MPISHTLSRRLRAESQQHDVSPMRRFSSRSGKLVNMGEISSPVSLLSTTNMLSYEAPHISVAQKALKVTPNPSYNAPRESHSASSTSSNEPPLTDGSSVETSPAVEFNHLSCYFPGPTRSKSTPNAAEAQEIVPALPQRALSHSKREHERLARKRSQKSGRSPAASSPTSPTGDRNSFDMIGKTSPGTEASTTLSPAMASVFSPLSPHSHQTNHHPFSNELEKLSEVAETFNDVTRSLEDDEDTIIMRQRGLAKFTVTDYLSEIGSLFPTTMFPQGARRRDNKAAWI